MALSFPSSPSSSSSSSTRQIKYDVFLSFRGEDTRYNFTSHLHQALLNKQIDTFIDYQHRKGDEISPSILQAIEGSQISIIIFSENYAYSIWCLEEVVNILKCKENHQQIVIPVFYEINPSDVRNQTRSFAVAFAKHEQRFAENLEKVQKWRCALKKAATLFGFDSRVVKPESVLVEKIVEDVLKRLNDMTPVDNEKLVGMESRITKIESLLERGGQIYKDVCSVGIWGIGGIGKTTLAKPIFDKIFYRFEGFHFVGNIREASEKRELNCLQQELYLAILGDQTAYAYPFTKKRLGHKKLLIIFDDVTNFKQVQYLIGNLDCLGSKSRIIITSRDKQVLNNCRMDYIFKLEELCYDDALKLFCQHAFQQNYPKVDYKKLSKGVVEMVGGVPLALEVLGSFLLGKEKEVWESTMKKLENILDKNIHEVLKISYDGLDYDQQVIFLDIACFCNGWDVNHVIAILNASDFFTENGISALTDKCLIFISDNKLRMHDLLQAMGKEIVRQESIDDPSKRSRLWHHKEIDDILTKATGTEAITGISLDMSKTKDIHLHPRAFVNMQKLRFLQFYISNRKHIKNKVHVLDGLEHIFTELRYLRWDRCPLRSLQSYFHSKNLVILKMCDSNVEELWSRVQQLDNLKEINVSWSKLIRFPDLRAPNLKSLILDGCTSLVEILSSFQHFTRLVFLSLFLCGNLSTIPELPKSLGYINVSGCSKFLMIQEMPNNARGCSSLVEIPSSIQHLTRLSYMDFGHCISLTAVPDCTCLISLKFLELTYCSKLKRLPELPNTLKKLCLSHCSSLVEIPSSIQHLTKLNCLDLSHCISLTIVPDCTHLISLEHLDLSYCSKLKRLPEIPEDFEGLYFEGCTSLFEIPSSCKHLNKLKKLRFRNCKSLTSISDFMGTQHAIKCCLELKMLPELPYSVRALYLEDIPMEESPSSFQDLCRQQHLHLNSP